MWLLDANMDVHLISLLQEFGVKCESANRRGWQQLTNGDLVKAAVEAGFHCLLTHDKLFGEAASRALKSSMNFSVVVIRLAQKPWKQYKEDFQSAWTKNPLQPVPGQILFWPANQQHPSK